MTYVADCPDCQKVWGPDCGLSWGEHERVKQAREQAAREAHEYMVQARIHEAFTLAVLKELYDETERMMKHVRPEARDSGE